MEKQDKKALESAFKGLIKRLEKTEAFVVEQAPDICKQMIYEKHLEQKFDLYSEIATIVVSSPLAVYFAMKCYTYSQMDRYDGTAILFLFGSLICVAFAIGNLFSLKSTINWLIYLKKCPKLFLLRRFRDFVNGD